MTARSAADDDEIEVSVIRPSPLNPRQDSATRPVGHPVRMAEISWDYGNRSVVRAPPRDASDSSVESGHDEAQFPIAYNSIVGGSSISRLNATRNCAPTAPSTTRGRTTAYRSSPTRPPLAVAHDRPRFAGPDRQDAGMRRVDDRGELAVPYMPRFEIGRAALKLLQLRLAGPDALGEVLGLGGDLREAPLVGALDDRCDQLVFERDRGGYRPATIRGSRRRSTTRWPPAPPQRQRRGADYEIVDRDAYRTLSLSSAARPPP